MIDIKPYLIELPQIKDPRGNLSLLENNKHIPFEINRVYWVYDVPGGEVRGSHAFKTTDEFIIALSGSFDVVIDDGVTELTYSLNRSYSGLLIPRMHWRTLTNFSTNSLGLIAASSKYHQEDYIRDFDEFRRACRESSSC